MFQIDKQHKIFDSDNNRTKTSKKGLQRAHSALSGRVVKVIPTITSLKSNSTVKKAYSNSTIHQANISTKGATSNYDVY